MKTIIIGITSGIACYKIIDLVKELKNSFKIEIIMTKNSLNLISDKEFKKLGCNIYTHLFNKKFNYKKYLKSNKQIKHISLADIADLLVIAPATANTIGKIANGIADSLLTSTAMATIAPILICPSMNSNMYNNPTVQNNIKKLKSLGHYFIEPEHGILACGYEGIGRLANTKKIKKEIMGLINKKDKLKGKKIIVTAGPTSEDIDPVRTITNKSSGKMGIYLAEEAAKMGAEVTLIRGKTEIEPSGKIKDIKISSVNDLFNKIKSSVKNNDTIFHAAAVSDFTIKREKNKISSNKKTNLQLKPTIKILEQIKKLNKNIFLVGFKAEYNISKEELIKRAFNKLKKSNADLIIANDVKNNPFSSENNEVFIVDKNKKIKHIKAEKRIITSKILDMMY